KLQRSTLIWTICTNKRCGPLQEQLAEEFARQLPDEAFHLQIKKRSENVGRVQAGVFDDVVNGSRLVGTEEGVNLLTAAGQGSGNQQIALQGLRLFGFSESGTDRCWQLFDDVVGIG